MAEKSGSPVRPEPKTRKKEQAETAAQREAALDLAAMQFKALGDPTRLRVIRLLGSRLLPVTEGAEAATEAVETPAGDAGLTVGDVSLGLYGKAKVSSTLSHHLKELRNAGLITMKRRGKNLLCRIEHDVVQTLNSYLPHAGVPPKANTGARIARKSVRKPKPKEGGPESDTNNSQDDASAL